MPDTKRYFNVTDFAELKHVPQEKNDNALQGKYVCFFTTSIFLLYKIQPKISLGVKKSPQLS